MWSKRVVRTGATVLVAVAADSSAFAGATFHMARSAPSVGTAISEALVTAATPATVTSASEIAVPTDGADLAMWNVAPAKADESAATATNTVAPVRTTRLLHIQKFAGGIAARGDPAGELLNVE